MERGQSLPWIGPRSHKHGQWECLCERVKVCTSRFTVLNHPPPKPSLWSILIILLGKEQVNMAAACVCVFVFDSVTVSECETIAVLTGSGQMYIRYNDSPSGYGRVTGDWRLRQPTYTLLSWLWLWAHNVAATLGPFLYWIELCSNKGWTGSLMVPSCSMAGGRHVDS